MQLLIEGVPVGRVAAIARVSVGVLLRTYRCHNVLRDSFETNGQFGRARLQIMAARVRPDGLHASAADVERLLGSAGLDHQQAGADAPMNAVCCAEVLPGKLFCDDTHTA
jgi:hypothetical protein